MKISQAARESMTGWQKSAFLFFKSTLWPAAALLLLTAAAQLTGVYLVLRQTAKDGFQGLPYGDGAFPSLWAPRLEAVMSNGLWFPFFAGGFILLLCLLMLNPLCLSMGGKALATLRRLPVGQGGLLLGGFLNALCWVICFWTVEFATLFGSHLLYRVMVPEEAQLTDALLMALLRWEPLGGLFPVARPWLLPVLLLEIAALALVAACTGFLLLNGKRYGGIFISIASLCVAPLLYGAGVNPLSNWYLWVLLPLAALYFLHSVAKTLREDPMAS